MNVVIEIDGRDGSIFKAGVEEGDVSVGDIVSTMSDEGRVSGTVIGLFRTQVEAEIWAVRRNCE
jgi:hypothetical protein